MPRKALGSPVASGDSSEQAFEDYRFRGKISDNGSAQMVGTLGALTLGLSEIVYIPTMLADLPRQMRQVHHVRYFYDPTGEVARFKHQDPPIVADQSDDRAKR